MRDFFPFIGMLKLMLNLREIWSSDFEGWLENFVRLLVIQLTGITPRCEGDILGVSYQLIDIEVCKLDVENFYEECPSISMPKIAIRHS